MKYIDFFQRLTTILKKLGFVSTVAIVIDNGNTLYLSLTPFGISTPVSCLLFSAKWKKSGLFETIICKQKVDR